MKKLLLTLSLALFLFSCDSGSMSKGSPQETKKPKIYKITYNGNGNTEGEVPVDNNLYAEGDTFYPKWSLDLKRNGYIFVHWEVSNVASVENPYMDYLNGTYEIRASSIIKFSSNDIELKALYADD